jgi:hypothetical protein
MREAFFRDAGGWRFGRRSMTSALAACDLGRQLDAEPISEQKARSETY